MMKDNKKTGTKKLTSFRIIVFGFAAVILIGALLLMTPFASKSGQPTDFLTALFTSTSAVCVTGLVVVDTGTYWSLFGRVVIISLIQIGGIGVVTVAAAISLAAGRRIGLMQRSVMSDSVSAPHIGGIVQLTRFILKGVILTEMVGAALMAPVFVQDYGLITGIGHAVFHSISAFCNAGFDLVGGYRSLTVYADNPIINMTIMGLIVIGGLGFLTWEDLVRNKWHFHKYRLQTKMILITTAILIALPAVFFYFTDFAAAVGSSRIWMSVFQSVTTRTAGFNTAGLTQLSESSRLVMVLLMLIGGAPGSKAGGIKVTVLLIMICHTIAVMKQDQNVKVLNRRIPYDVLRTAVAIFMMYLILCLTGSIVMSTAEGLPILTCMFECASALGTVGLTLGITPQLALLSRIMLILFMYIGRVGGMTLAFAAKSKLETFTARLPEERVMVG